MGLLSGRTEHGLLAEGARIELQAPGHLEGARLEVACPSAADLVYCAPMAVITDDGPLLHRHRGVEVHTLFLLGAFAFTSYYTFHPAH